MKCSDRKDTLGGTGGIGERCCTGQSGCNWDGTLRNVVTEPIYVQKVYDAVLFNLQGLKTAPNTVFEPRLGCETNIVRIADIRCRKFFNPDNINDNCNLKIKPVTTLSGGQFVKNEDGCDYKVIGPDGTLSERLVWADTQFCDEEEQGTPVFGTQNIEISGAVEIEMDLVVSPCNSDNESIISVWKSTVEAGKEYGILPAGLGARDTLRFEANLPLYGNELSEDISPIEAGYGFFVKTNKEDFVGKDALLRQKKDGIKRNKK